LPHRRTRGPIVHSDLGAWIAAQPGGQHVGGAIDEQIVVALTRLRATSSRQWTLGPNSRSTYLIVRIRRSVSGWSIRPAFAQGAPPSSTCPKGEQLSDFVGGQLLRATEQCGTTRKTVKRVIERRDARPARWSNQARGQRNRPDVPKTLTDSRRGSNRGSNPGEFSVAGDERWRTLDA